MSDYLGRTATDKITGVSGVITGHCTYLTGCSQVLVQPRAKNGEMVESQWFDQQRVELGNEPAIVLDNGPTPGCDRAAPRR